MVIILTCDHNRKVTVLLGYPEEQSVPIHS